QALPAAGGARHPLRTRRLNDAPHAARARVRTHNRKEAPNAQALAPTGRNRGTRDRSGADRDAEVSRAAAEGGADRAERAQRPRVHAVDAPRAPEPAEEVQLPALPLGEPVRR